MTGFAKLETESPEGKLYCEARSLNNRYLEISIKLPKADFPVEQKLREIVKRHIKRGKVDVTVKWERPGEQGSAQKINEAILTQYIETVRVLKEKYRLKGGLTVENVFTFKDIFSYDDNNNIGDGVLEKSFEDLMVQLNAERDKEGAMIRKDLLERLNTIMLNVLAIEGQLPITMKAHEEKLRERIMEVVKATAVDENRVLQELAIYMERIDISEEVLRLRGHIDNFRETINAQEPIGRKLDFIIQEMMRETNTIGSKANDLAINEKAIQIKVEIEKIREQVQNIE